MALLEIPAELSLCTAPAAADGAALRAVEMAAHLRFTVDLEMRVVAPAAGLLAHRLDAHDSKYGRVLRCIAVDEVEHAFAAIALLRLCEPSDRRDCPAIDAALDAIRACGLSASDAVVVMFLVAECVVSTYLAGVHELPGDSPGLTYLREHARDELGHGRFVRALLATLLAEPALLLHATGIDSPVRFTTALGVATRGYAEASVRTIEEEAGRSGAWRPARAYAGDLAQGLRPVFAGDATAVAAFDRGLLASA